jgi:crotonobetainyl-CoA:carnitine CoA-transferase CaiB-like acyl-CoA transferase
VTEALSQPQAKAREMVVDVEHATLGQIPIVNRPFKFDEPQALPTAPPILGEHTAAILADVLGLDDARIEELRASGIVA